MPAVTSPQLSSTLSFDSTAPAVAKPEVRKETGSLLLKLATSLAALPSPTWEQVLPLVRECPTLHARAQGSGQSATSTPAEFVTTTEIDALLAVAHFLLHSNGKLAEELLPILLHNIRLLPFTNAAASISKDDFDDPYSPRVVFGSLFEYLAGVACMQLPSGFPRAAISHTITETTREVLEAWVDNPNLRRSGVARSGTWGFLQALGDVHLHLCPRDKSLIAAALHAQWLDLPGQAKLVGDALHPAALPGPSKARDTHRAVAFQSGTKGASAAAADGSGRTQGAVASGGSYAGSHDGSAADDISHSTVLGQLLGVKLAFRAMAAMIRGRWRKKAVQGVAGGGSVGGGSAGSSQGEAMERNVAAHLRGTRRDRVDGFRSYCLEQGRSGTPGWVLVEHSRILDGYQLDEEEGAYSSLSDDEDDPLTDGLTKRGLNGAILHGTVGLNGAGRAEAAPNGMPALNGDAAPTKMVIKGKGIKVAGAWLVDDGLEEVYLATAYEFVSSVIEIVRSSRGSFTLQAKPKPDGTQPFHDKIMTSPSLSAAMFSATREAAVLLSQVLARRAHLSSPSSTLRLGHRKAGHHHQGRGAAPGGYVPGHVGPVAVASIARDAVFHFMALVDGCITEGYTLQYSCCRMAAVLVQEAASIAILQARGGVTAGNTSPDDSTSALRISQGEELTEVVLLRMKVQLLLPVPELYLVGVSTASAETGDLGLSANEYRERKEQLQRTLIAACCRVCRAEWERGAYAPVRTFLVLLGESLQQLDMTLASTADASGRNNGAPTDTGTDTDDALPGLLLSFFVSLVRAVGDPVLSENVLAQLAYDRVSDDAYATDSSYAVKVLEAVCDIASVGHAGPYSTVVTLLSKLFKDPVEQRAFRSYLAPGGAPARPAGAPGTAASGVRVGQGGGPDAQALGSVGRSASISQLQPEDVMKEGLARLASPFYSKEVPRLLQRFAMQLGPPSLRADLRIRLLDLFSYMGSLILDQGSASHEAYLATLLPAIASACRDLPPGNPPGWNFLDWEVAKGPPVVAREVNPGKRVSLALAHEISSKVRPTDSLADASSLDAQAPSSEAQVITPALRRLFRNLWFYIAFLGYAPPVALRRAHAGAPAKGGNGGDGGEGGLFRWDKNAAWVSAVAEIAEVTPPLNPSESHKRAEVESELSALLQLYKSGRSRRHLGKKLRKPRVGCMKPKADSPTQRAPAPRFSLDTSVSAGAPVVAAATGGGAPATPGYGVAAEGPRKALELLLGKTIDAAALAGLSDGMATFLLSVAHLELLRLGHESSLRGKCSLAPVLSYLNNPDANPEEQRVVAAIAECVFAAVLASLDRGDSVAQLGWGLQHQDFPGGGPLSVDAATRWSLCDTVLQRHTYTLLSGVAMRGTVLRKLSNSFLRRLMQHHPQILHSPACMAKLLRVVGEVGFLHENEARGGGAAGGAGSLLPRTGSATGLLRGAYGSISATVAGGSAAGVPASTMGGDLGDISKEVQQLLHLWLTRAAAAAPLTTQCLVQEYARQNNDIDISLLASLLPPTLVLPPKQGREAVLATDTGGGFSVITAVAVGGHSTQRAKGAGASAQNPVSAFVSAITAKSLAVGEVQGMREYGRAMAKLAPATLPGGGVAGGIAGGGVVMGVWALPAPGMGAALLGRMPFGGGMVPLPPPGDLSGGGLSEDAVEESCSRVLVATLVHELRSFVAAVAKGEPVDELHFSEVTTKAAAVLILEGEARGGSEDCVQLLRLLCWSPVHLFTSGSIRAGVFSWSWLLAACPSMGSRVLAEVTDAWLWTVEMGYGLFAGGQDKSGPHADLRPHICPGPPRSAHGRAAAEGGREGDLVVEQILAHRILIGFFADRFEVVRYRSVQQMQLLYRLLTRSLARLEGVSHHPTAVGPLFALLLLGSMLVATFQLENPGGHLQGPHVLMGDHGAAYSDTGSLEGATENGSSGGGVTSEGIAAIAFLRDRIQRFALNWFAYPPSLYDTGRADVATEAVEHLRAFAGYWSRTQMTAGAANGRKWGSRRRRGSKGRATANDPPTSIKAARSYASWGGQDGGEDPASVEDALLNELIVLLCWNEAERLEVWAHPLRSWSSTRMTPSERMRGDKRWKEFVRASWKCDPRIAVQLATRFPTEAAVEAELITLVQNNATEIHHIPEALPFLVTPSAAVADLPVLRQLAYWAPCSIIAAFAFLKPEYATQKRVMAYVMRVLKMYPAEDVTSFLPQLVQALRYDTAGLLEDFLVEETQRSNVFAFQLIWVLQGEEACPVEPADPNQPKPPSVGGAAKAKATNVLHSITPRLIQRIINGFSPDQRDTFEREFRFFDKVTSISGKLFPVPKPERRAGIKGELLKIQVEGDDLYLPTDPSLLVRGIDSESGIPLQSAAKVPIMVTFFVVHRDRPEHVFPQKCIFKVGDDCRQDVFALQLIGLMRDIFKAVGLGIYLFPYGVLPTGYERGIIEVVPNASSRNSLGEESDGGLHEIFQQLFGPTGSPGFEKARHNFIVSSAGYAVASLLLQPKDRHNGNLLIDAEGHLVHIDFGFILEISPGGNMGFESAAFKMTHEMTQLLDPGGAKSSEEYAYFLSLCVRGYLAVRNHTDVLVNFVAMMMDSGLPCFSYPKGQPHVAVSRLKARLHPEMNDKQAAHFMLNVCNDAYGKWTTAGYDVIQYLQQGITH